MAEINLTKFIASNSDYSRRQAEDLIRNNNVTVDNVLAVLGAKVQGTEKVQVMGRDIIPTEDQIYIKINKPEGYTCSNRVFKNEKSVFSLIDSRLRLFSVGRLDKNSSGLLILTNDGDLTYQLTHPKFQHSKIYWVRLSPDNRLRQPDFLNSIAVEFRRGIDIQEKTLARARNLKFLGNDSFQVELTEGKKRQIREMFLCFNLKVQELIRVEFSGIKLGNLKVGEFKNLSGEEIKKLKYGAK